jgi:hypothetical protein
MTSILGLFKETANEKSTRLKYFDNNIYNSIPLVDYPSFNSEEFDIEEVERCHNNPCLATSFLRDSDSSVFDIFKSYCDQNNISNVDWNKVKDIMRDVKTVIGILKNKFNRPRPVNFMSHEYNIKYKSSPSYPSGHTTQAYFLCDLLSDSLPNIKSDLQTLASLIGQSRIENAVHYPSDIQYGRLIGETLCKGFLTDDVYNEKPLHVQILERCTKEKIDKIEYSKEIAEFIFESITSSGFKCSYSDCVEASQNFLMGFPINYISENIAIKSMFNCLIAANKYDVINEETKAINVHKKFDSKFLFKSLPGEKRKYENLDSIFLEMPHNKFKRIITERPFKDGNIRIGKILLLKDLDFQFELVNKIITK